MNWTPRGGRTGRFSVPGMARLGLTPISASKGFISGAVDAAMKWSNLNSDSTVEDERKNSLPVGDSTNSIELPTDLDIEPPVILSTTLG